MPRRCQPAIHRTILIRLSVATLTILVAGSTPPTAATGAFITYGLVSYPSEQSGLSLVGAITTDGTIGILTLLLQINCSW